MQHEIINRSITFAKFNEKRKRMFIPENDMKLNGNKSSNYVRSHQIHVLF